MGENPTERLAVGGCLQTLALCTVSNFADTLRRFAVYPRFALCRAALLNPLFEYIRTDDRCAYTSECEYKRIEVGVRRLFTNACVFFQ